MSVAVQAGAIVFTDFVGFTQFTEERGDEVALALLEQQDVIVQKVLPPGGRVVKELGDGLMLWFDEADAAIATCLVLQRQFEESSCDEIPLGVRMGLHWGTPRRRGDDLVGRDVNLAARIAELAGPGELLLSAAAVDAAGTPWGAAVSGNGSVRPAFGGVRFEELGPVFVRGVPDPVRLFRAARVS